MDYKDYYSTLGVSKDATKDEIQKAYRKLARKHHPDINKSDGAEAKFKEINEAYEVLKDQDRRQKYDRFGSAWQQAQTTGAPPPGFEDIFSAFSGAGVYNFDLSDSGFSSFFDLLFGSGLGREGAAGTGQRVRWTTDSAGFSQAGADHDARITVSLEEAARGGKRELNISDPASGSRRKLRVKIPPGIRSGQRIRLAGQGGKGSGSGPRGHLYLTIEIRPHDRFRLEESDLHTTLPVSPWEAALGGEAEVPTLDGIVKVKIPAGSSSGRKIRLRGKGFPVPDGQPGDLLAELRIVVPERLTEREQELFEQLARESDFRARHSQWASAAKDQEQREDKT